MTGFNDETTSEVNQADTPTTKTGSSGLTKAQSIYASQGIVDSFIEIGSGYNEAAAIESKRRFNNNNLLQNANFAERSAKDAIKRGSKQADDHMRRVGRLIGAQRAAFATQGIEIDRGSARDIQNETFSLGLEDAVQIRNNSYLEAFGFESQAIASRSQAILNRIASKSQAKQEKIATFNRVVQSTLGAASKIQAAKS